jgi:hypothetical protein
MLGRDIPTHDVRLGYAVSSSRSLTSGRDVLRTMRLGVYVILVLGGFTTSDLYYGCCLRSSCKSHI